MAFDVHLREPVKTYRELAVRLAGAAKVIRARVRSALAAEQERVELRRLYAAFREALIHDLSADDFADMYAETVACVLLSASISREEGGDRHKASLAEMLANTGAFLKEFMQAFLTCCGGECGVDFEEHGACEVQELLRRTRIDAVLEDFARRNPQEDPVIHFYELFLKEYDPEKRARRGVFYTPRSVVSFMVRSVDETLRTRFRLEDGLADTATWREMRKRHEGLAIPMNVGPDEPFVQILDPAAGTGTFLVEVIDRIYETLRAKWRRQGKSESEMLDLWNDYVPEHLLPRLHGFELMTAPYAIAHMKVWMKLSETRYGFLSMERARIYLTNTLEAPSEVKSRLKQAATALGLEALAADEVKRSTPFTVVLGNPPYAGISGNVNGWIDGLLRGRPPDGSGTTGYYEVDGKPLGERKLWLQDDYVKFMRFAEHRIELSGAGLLCYISNHGYLDNPTFRGMRQHLMRTFSEISILDLHGNAKKERRTRGQKDRNVFDIEQGVSIGLFSSLPCRTQGRSVKHMDLWGERDEKYEKLCGSTMDGLGLSQVLPASPFYFFVPRNEANLSEYERGWKITEIMPAGTSGIVTARDAFVIDFDREALLARISEFRDERLTDEFIRRKYFAGKGSARYEAGDTRGWKLPAAREEVRADARWRERVEPILYRPFDVRNIYNVSWMVDWPRRGLMRHMRECVNLGLITSRMTKGETFRHAQVTRLITEVICMSPKTSNNGFLFPLYLYEAEAASGRMRRANLSQEFVAALSGNVGMRFELEGRGDLANTFGPEDVFHYIYAIFHSETYRTRYAEFLRTDFPRVHLTSDPSLFGKLCQAGADLAALHLLEDDYEAASWNAAGPEGLSPLRTFTTRFAGQGGTEITKGHPCYRDRKVYINPSSYFEEVPEEVWSFYVGGYRVCEKWLKSRRGRALTGEEITLYLRVVAALGETTRLMAEIESTIEGHGGWPIH